MNRVFDFFKTVWSWFYERTVIWFIFAFFLMQESITYKASAATAESIIFTTYRRNILKLE